MRFSVITLLLFFTITSSATAQHFQPFRNKYKYQYTYTGYIKNLINSELIHGIEVDSAKIIDSDSVFYFNRLSTDRMRQTSTDNFWGSSMVKKINGEYLFLVTNYDRTDTVIIKTQETLGSQWTFKLKNTLYTAHYYDYKQEHVLTNQLDYVKTFIVENTLGFKDSIKISENFGLVYSFPFLEKIYPTPNNHFNLTYILNTKTGINKLNYFDYFNYDEGDILIYEPNLTYPNRPPVGNDVLKLLSKNVSLNGDTVAYSFSKCHIDAFDETIYTTTQSHCELIVTECSVTGNFPSTYILSFPPNKYDAFYAFAPNMQNNHVLQVAPPYVFEQPFSEYIFQPDLGLRRYGFIGGRYETNRSYSNTSFIKQSNINDDCDGLELILDTKTLHSSSTNLVLSPNPFDHSIAITASNLNPGNWNVRITSTLGVEVYNSVMVISSSNQQIDLSNLSTLTAGIYFLSLENENQVHSQKIMKQ